MSVYVLCMLCQHVFRPPRSTFDVVIELNLSQLAQEHCAVDAVPSVVPSLATYTEPKVPGKQPWPVIGYNPVLSYLQELRVSPETSQCSSPSM